MQFVVLLLTHTSNKLPAYIRAPQFAELTKNQNETIETSRAFQVFNYHIDKIFFYYYL